MESFFSPHNVKLIYSILGSNFNPGYVQKRNKYMCTPNMCMIIAILCTTDRLKVGQMSINKWIVKQIVGYLSVRWNITQKLKNGQLTGGWKELEMREAWCHHHSIITRAIDKKRYLGIECSEKTLTNDVMVPISCSTQKN